jgi:fatty acid desaturase
MATTMCPPPEAVPDVLPTERLLVSGKAIPPIRAELRRIPNLRNAVAVAGALVQSVGLIAAAVAVDRWWAYLICFCLMGRAHALFAALSHEAAHRLLFSRRRVNDAVGRWVVGYPAFIATDLYRRGHMAHHKEEFGPTEPDMNLYVGYPVSRRSLARKLARDAVGVSGWKNLRSLLRGARSGPATRHARRIIAVQVVLAGAAAAAGHWWVYWALWFLPWMTQWRVINRLRAIAEHGGMQHSADRRLTTHTVRQHLPARLFLVPYNIGWHLAHHVDMGIPWRNLPAFHRELEEAGYITVTLEHRSYLALWRALASGRAEGRMGTGRGTPAPAAPDLVAGL